MNNLIIKPFPFVQASSMTVKPVQVDWLIKDVLERDSLNLLFGEPGACKTLFALDWAFCIAGAIKWNEHKTKQADVIYIMGEGFSGIGRRLKALEHKYQVPTPERLFISQQPAQFLDIKNVEQVANSIKAISTDAGLVVIDTLHRNMSGDENSSQDIGKFINHIDLHLKPLGVAVLIVHHSGHGQKERSRGSSSIRGAMDAEFSSSKSADGIVLTCHKAKDFEEPKPMLFKLMPVTLNWLDDENKPLTSVHLEHIGDAKPTANKARLSVRDEAILQSLNDAITLHGIEPNAEIKTKFSGFDSFEGKHQKIVFMEHWRPLAYKSINADANTDGAKRMALKRCRDKLMKQKLIVEYDGYIWRIFK